MIKYIYKLTLAIALVGMVACESFVDEASEIDPTRPTDASLGQVITSAEVGYVGFLEGDLARLAGMFTGQFTGTDRQYINLNNYTVTAADFDAGWGNVYAVALKSMRIAKAKAQESGNTTTLGLAQVLEGHTLGMAAALWGQMPYEQAINFDEFPNPQYQDQNALYTTAMNLLDNGITNLQSGVGSIEGDIFGLSVTQWVAAANTVKAKFYLHMGDYANAAASASQGIQSPDGNVTAEHGTTYQLDFNIYYSFLVYDRGGYMAATDAYAPRLLDPSLPASRNNADSLAGAVTVEGARFDYTYLADGFYVGGYEPNYLSQFDWGAPDGYFGTETAWDVITYRENQLILAEAQLRQAGFAPALATLNEYRAYLDAGGYFNPDYIVMDADTTPVNEDNNIYEPFTAADFQPGGIQNPDNISAEDALYREIIEEKYLSLIGHLEVFNDMRRSGYGSFANQQNWQVIGITPNTGNEIPQRFLIPQDEINSNTSTPSPIPGLFERTPVFQ